MNPIRSNQIVAKFRSREVPVQWIWSNGDLDVDKLVRASQVGTPDENRGQLNSDRNLTPTYIRWRSVGLVSEHQHTSLW